MTIPFTSEWYIRRLEEKGFRIFPPIPDPEVDLTPGEYEIWQLLTDKPRLPRYVASLTPYAHNSVRRFLTLLGKKGYAARIGSHRKGGWVQLNTPVSNEMPIAA